MKEKLLKILFFLAAYNSITIPITRDVLRLPQIPKQGERPHGNCGLCFTLPNMVSVDSRLMLVKNVSGSMEYNLAE